MRIVIRTLDIIIRQTGTLEASSEGNNFIRIPNILFSQALSENLLSLRKLAEQGLEINLSKKGIRVIDPRSGKIVVSGIFKNKFWWLKFKIINQANSILFFNTTSNKETNNKQTQDNSTGDTQNLNEPMNNSISVNNDSTNSNNNSTDSSNNSNRSTKIIQNEGSSTKIVQNEGSSTKIVQNEGSRTKSRTTLA